VHDAKKTVPRPIPSVIPPELNTVIAAANAGDMSALPDLRRALTDHPDLVDRLGDLAAHVEQGLIALAAGPSLAGSEAITAHLAKMRAELGEASASPLEKLLVRRVVLCWLAAHQADLERLELAHGHAAEALRAAAEKRANRAHARFLSASKALATVRKLLRPELSPVELAIAVVPEGRPGFANRVRGLVGAAS
jgi:hypothetical protein